MVEVGNDPKQSTAYPPAQALPHLSSDGRWWWNGKQWIPAPRRPNMMARSANVMAGLALVFGIFAILYSVLLMPSDLHLGKGLSDILGISAPPAAPGVVLGILALALPVHGHNLRQRRTMAWIGIACALLGFIISFFVMLAYSQQPAL